MKFPKAYFAGVIVRVSYTEFLFRIFGVLQRADE